MFCGHVDVSIQNAKLMIIRGHSYVSPLSWTLLTDLLSKKDQQIFKNTQTCLCKMILDSPIHVIVVHHYTKVSKAK